MRLFERLLPGQFVCDYTTARWKAVWKEICFGAAVNRYAENAENMASQGAGQNKGPSAAIGQGST